MKKIFVGCLWIFISSAIAADAQPTVVTEPAQSTTTETQSTVTIEPVKPSEPEPAYARNGFYLHISPVGFGFTTDSDTAPLLPLEIGGGFDFNEYLALEADFSLGLFWEPYDATSFEGVLRGIIYPFSRSTFSPFVSLGVGRGSIEDNTVDTSDDMVLIGASVGSTLFLGERHGIVFRISDTYHFTDYVKGDFNVIQASLLYRLSI